MGQGEGEDGACVAYLGLLGSMHRLSRYAGQARCSMSAELLHGALEMLVMDVLSAGRGYGYQIAQSVMNGSGERLAIKEGSLYPALHRLEARGWLDSEWGKSPEGRRRKYYRLTPAGERALADKRRDWDEFSRGVSGVLGRGAGA